MQSMEDVLKNFQKKSIEGFPNGIPEGFSNGVDGPILEETQGMFYKKKVPILISTINRKNPPFLLFLCMRLDGAKFH